MSSDYANFGDGSKERLATILASLEGLRPRPRDSERVTRDTEISYAELSGMLAVEGVVVAEPVVIGEDTKVLTVKAGDFEDRLGSLVGTIVEEKRHERLAAEAEERQRADDELRQQVEEESRRVIADETSAELEREIVDVAHQAAVFILNNGGSPHYLRPSIDVGEEGFTGRSVLPDRESYEKFGLWILNYRDEKNRETINAGGRSSASSYVSPSVDTRQDTGWGSGAHQESIDFEGQHIGREWIDHYWVSGLAFDYSGKLWRLTIEKSISLTPVKYTDSMSFLGEEVTRAKEGWSRSFEEFTIAHLLSPIQYPMKPTQKSVRVHYDSSAHAYKEEDA